MCGIARKLPFRLSPRTQCGDYDSVLRTCAYVRMCMFGIMRERGGRSGILMWMKAGVGYFVAFTCKVVDLVRAVGPLTILASFDYDSIL